MNLRRLQFLSYRRTSSAPVPRPPKEELLARHVSRFGKKISCCCSKISSQYIAFVHIMSSQFICFTSDLTQPVSSCLPSSKTNKQTTKKQGKGGDPLFRLLLFFGGQVGGGCTLLQFSPVRIVQKDYCESAIHSTDSLLTIVLVIAARIQLPRHLSLKPV